MKVTLALIGLLNTASALSSSRQQSNRLLSKARRLDDGGDNGGDVDESVYEFMDDYSIKVKQCYPDITLGYNDDGYPSYGVVVFRMCPSNSCKDNKQPACKSGYADFAVDIGTYVAAMMNDQADNMNWDDQYGDLADYANCAQYQTENGDSYYIGPTCTSDGKDLALGLFTDAYCAEPAGVSFESVSNGWSMPYTDGGLVNSACTSCYDNDEGALKELCSTLYESAAYRCEEDWSVNHYYYDAITEVNKYGLDTTGCKSIAHFNWTMPKINVWEELAFSIILVGVAVAGWFYYSSWWAKRKYCEESLDFCVLLMDGISQMDSFIYIVCLVDIFQKRKILKESTLMMRTKMRTMEMTTMLTQTTTITARLLTTSQLGQWHNEKIPFERIFRFFANIYILHLKEQIAFHICSSSCLVLLSIRGTKTSASCKRYVERHKNIQSCN